MELEQKNCQQKASYDRITELEQLNSLLDRQVVEFQHTLNSRNSTYELLQSNHNSTLAELQAKECEMQQLNMQKGESQRALAGLNADYGRYDQLQSNHDAAVAELEAIKSETGHLKTLLDTQERESKRALAALNTKYNQLQSSHAVVLAGARGRPDAAPTNELSLLRDLEKKGKQLDHMRDLLQHSGMLLWLLCCCSAQACCCCYSFHSTVLSVTVPTLSAPHRSPSAQRAPPLTVFTVFLSPRTAQISSQARDPANPAARRPAEPAVSAGRSCSPGATPCAF